MTARNWLYTLPAPVPIGGDSEVHALGVRYDPDTSPPEYQPLLRAMKKTSGTEIPSGTIQFDVQFTDGTYSSTVMAGSVSDASPFDGANPVHNRLYWYEWDPARTRFERLDDDPTDGAVDTIDSGDGIDITSTKTPRAIRFSWVYTS